MLSNPLGNVLGKPPLGFLPLDPIGSDVPEKFSTPSLRNSRSLLDSRSSSPSDSDTSGFSSGSDHLSDLIVSLGPGVVLCSWGAQNSLVELAARAQPAQEREGMLGGAVVHTLVQPRVWEKGCSCSPSAHASSNLIFSLLS